MKQIEILDNKTTEGIYQTFIIDHSHDFPYYRPLYLIGRVEDEKQAAKSAKRQYFLDHSEQIPTIEKYNERKKQIKVIAKPVNREQDIKISGYVRQFNDAKNVASRTTSEMMHRIAEEKIHELILNY